VADVEKVIEQAIGGWVVRRNASEVFVDVERMPKMWPEVNAVCATLEKALRKAKVRFVKVDMIGKRWVDRSGEGQYIRVLVG
jgi:hypothetical protein